MKILILYVLLLLFLRVSVTGLVAKKKKKIQFDFPSGSFLYGPS